MAMRLFKIFVTAFLLTASTNAFAESQGKIPRVGVIMTGTPKTHGRVIRELRRGLHALGYREGKNITLEPRYAMRKRAQLSKLARELLSLEVDLIVVTGAGAARATRKESPSIPIVVASARDLVGSGIVTSLAKPGGNTTGNTAYSGGLGAKQMELLKEAIPGLKRIAVLFSEDITGSHRVNAFKRMKAAAPQLGIAAIFFGVRKPEEFDGTFSTITNARAEAVILTVSRLTSVYRDRLIELAATWKVPAICWGPSMARKGCFMSYGVDRNAMYRHAATFVHKILKGAKPADLPVEQPTRYKLVVNLKTAKALGIVLPQSVLLRADEVIE